MAELKKKNETVSVSTHELVEGSHLLKVTGYSLMLENKSCNDYIQSTPFEVGGYMWAINYYPKYFSRYSSIYTVLLSDGKNVKANVKFIIINQFETPSHIKPHNDKLLTFVHKGIEHGCDFFIKNKDLLPYVQDDTFIVRCTLRVLTSSVKKVVSPPIREVPPSKICSDLAELLESGERNDVTFAVKGKLFHAHKCVLAARSPYFRAQFYGPLKSQETLQHTKVEGIEPIVFKALLCYIYTDMFPKIEELGADTELQLSRTMLAHKLLEVADHYLLDRLKVICVDMLCDEIHDDNVSMCLFLAERYNCGQLKTTCLEYLADPENLALAMLTEGFSQIVLYCPPVLKDLKEKVGHQSLKKTLSIFQHAFFVPPDITWG